MDDQAPGAVDADPLSLMMGLLDAEDDEPTDDTATEPEDEADENAEEADAKSSEEAPQELETIVHNGEEKKLTKDELKELAQQGFDYTQKTQQIAEQRRYLEQQEAAIQQRAQFAAQFTDQLAQAKALQGQLEQWQKVNWIELAQTDPMQYLSLHHQYNDAKEAYQAQVQSLTQAQQNAQQAEQQQRAERLAREAQAMTQAIPEWKDTARANAEMGELRSWLAKTGVSEQEIESISDHRHVAIARKAMLYDKLVAQGKQKVSTAPPPTAKPGSTAKPNTDGNKMRDALKRTGKGDFAAKLIEQML